MDDADKRENPKHEIRNKFEIQKNKMQNNWIPACAGMTESLTNSPGETG
jgi:hypothetical protein